MSNVEKIKVRIFENDFEGRFVKTMWRMCRGNRDAIFKLTKDLATKHYGFSPDDDDIEIALGEMNSGVEVEFAS